MKKVRKLLAGILALVMILCMLPTTVVATAEDSHLDLAREAVGEGIVLLKNKDVLPLDSSNTVALFGGGQRYTGSTTTGYQIGGGGSGTVYLDYTPAGPANAILEAADDGEINVYEALTEKYMANVNYVPDEAMYEAAAEAADTAIMFITRFSEESVDISVSEWYLTDAEETMLKELSERFENVVVLINAPSMMATDWSLDDNEYGIDIDALLVTYMGGEMGAYGMTDILLGKENPSGKLVDTYAYDVYDYSTTETFLESPSYVRYTEDIYVGYRYFETFAKDKVVYEFGFGLSYTTFDIETESVTADDENITITVKVTNTGDAAGKEVVQVYYSAPQAGEGDAVLSKSAIELAAFEKTDLLEPGESQTIKISYAIDDMASFDDNGLSGHESCYVLEAGDYEIIVGNSVRNNKVAGKYTVDELVVTEELSELCATTLDVRLTADGTYETINDVDGDDDEDSRVNKNSVYTVECENFTTLYGTFTPRTQTFGTSGATAGWIYNGTEWVKTGTGGNLADTGSCANTDIGYAISVKDAGTYHLGFVAANGRNNNLDIENIMTVYIMKDGEATYSDIQYDSVNTYYAQPTTGTIYYNFVYTNVDFQGNDYEIELPEGDYEIVISFNSNINQANINFDKFYIIPEGMDYTLAQVMETYDYTEEVYEELGLDLDEDNYVGIKYEDVVSGEATIGEFIAQMSLNEMIDFCSGHTAAVTTGTGTIGTSSDKTAEKYGIYSADTANGPAGVRTKSYYSTYWPCSTLQACTWNTELVEEIGKYIGDEALVSMADIWLAPGMNIHRSPLCGRNFEYYSEDPLVSGKIAAAVTRGVQSKCVTVVIKHFCANNKEANRSDSDSRISEKALREIYLKGFEIAIKESNPAWIMTSYNYLNGIETAENEDLLKGIVRGEWGWDGCIMTDWNNNSAIADEINAGNNVKMQTGDLDEVRKAVQYGIITRETLEENTMYIVNALAKCPDYTINQYKVHELSLEDSTYIPATEYSRKSYHSYFEKVTVLDELCTSYAQKTDADGHALFLEFKVDAPVAGIYSLELAFSSNNIVRYNVFEIYVNGELVEGLNADVPASGSWSTYTTMTIGDIVLPEGESVIKLQHIHSTGINYRGISLSNVKTFDTQCVEISSAEAEYGEEVTLQVTNNYEGLSSFMGRVESDVTLKDITTEYPYEYNEKTGAFIVWANDYEGFVAGEVIAELNFEVTNSAEELPSGEYEVNIVDIAATDEDGVDFSVFTAETGYITVVHPVGDVNMDGTISNADVITIARYLVKIIELNEQQLELADVNGDGVITNADLVKLVRSIIG